jgi:hypothetical protein
MKALIVHYHLKPGGVTTVIRRQLSALSARGIDAAVLSGEAARGQGGAVSVEPALGYDPEPRAPAESLSGSAREPDGDRVAAIVRAVRREAEALGGETVVHVHNPTIRKNSSMLAALSELAARGTRLVLHVHDLAEDWRPDVYSSLAYPEGALWACINRFDAAALKTAGAGDVSYLPNPVPCPAAVSPAGGASAEARGKSGLVLYPVRGIRRKNLGEAVLLSLFMREEGRLGVTLPPTSPKDAPYYQGWLELASTLYAPITFGLGLGRGLEELYAASTAALTTSVKEGFGMAFLEPASRGLPTLGRRLPRVVADFEAEGLAFPDLYASIRVPPGLFDEAAFAERVRVAAASALEAYGLRDPDFPEAVAENALGGSGPDFGRLDEPAQEQVLRAVARSRRDREAVLAANPFLEGWDARAESIEPVGPEALSPWSEALYGERLEALYRHALERGGGAAPAKAALLGLYLRPEAFHGVGV